MIRVDSGLARSKKVTFTPRILKITQGKFIARGLKYLSTIPNLKPALTLHVPQRRKTPALLSRNWLIIIKVLKHLKNI